MSEYIIWESDKTETTDNLGMKHGVSHFEKREEIVRCRDCKHYNDQEPGGEIGTCNLGLEDTGLVSIVEPDGFCAWGERR